jgi:hypothetical protein
MNLTHLVNLGLACHFDQNRDQPAPRSINQTILPVSRPFSSPDDAIRNKAPSASHLIRHSQPMNIALERQTALDPGYER